MPHAYFLEVTAEKCITKYSKGQEVRAWVKKMGRRNEALDCLVYAWAAFQNLGIADVNRLCDELQGEMIDSEESPGRRVAHPGLKDPFGR